jgi:hypothetical protein
MDYNQCAVKSRIDDIITYEIIPTMSEHTFALIVPVEGPTPVETMITNMGELFSELDSVYKKVNEVSLELREICTSLNVNSWQEFINHDGITEQIKIRFFDSFEAKILLNENKIFNKEKVLEDLKILYVFLSLLKSSLLL